MYKAVGTVQVVDEIGDGRDWLGRGVHEAVQGESEPFSP